MPAERPPMRSVARAKDVRRAQPARKKFHTPKQRVTPALQETSQRNDPTADNGIVREVRTTARLPSFGSRVSAPRLWS